MPVSKIVKLIDAVTTTGAGISHILFSSTGKFTIEAVFTEGDATSCDALTIDIEGSVTGSNWFSLTTHAFTEAELTAGAAMFHIADRPVAFFRGNVKTLTKTGANDVTVDVWLLS